MTNKTVKIINRTLTILFFVSIGIIFLGYLVPQTYHINVGLIGFTILMFTAFVFLGFAFYNMANDIGDEIKNEDNRDDR